MQDNNTILKIYLILPLNSLKIIIKINFINFNAKTPTSTQKSQNSSENVIMQPKAAVDRTGGAVGIPLFHPFILFN